MRPKSQSELAKMRQGGKILADVISKIVTAAKPGESLINLNNLAEKLIKKARATPAFKGYHGYPFATTMSVNEEVVHGIPRDYQLKEGDVLGIDVGVLYQGFNTDSAVTVGVGEISATDRHLIKVTREALWVGLGLIGPGVQLGDVQAAIQEFIEKQGFTVVRDLCGHGIGEKLQEEPQIPNFGNKGTGPVLTVGSTLAIEPMVSYHAPHVATKDDGWTVVTMDGKNAAHFEHTVAVSADGVEVLTLREDEIEVLQSVH